MSEDERRLTLADYLAILDRIPDIFRRSWDAIAIYDLEGRLTAGNAPARALVGPERAATLVGLHFNAHLALDDARKSARAFAEVVTTGEPYDGFTFFSGPDGEPIPVRTLLVPARVDGHVVGVIGFARDARTLRAPDEAPSEGRRIAELYRIAATPTIVPDDKVRIALATGMRELNFEWAYVGHVVDDMLEITYTAGAGPGALDLGARIEVERSAVRFALASNDLYATEDAPAAFDFDAGATRRTWRSFAGAPLTVDGERYGAMGFVSTSHAVRLGQGDRDYLRAIASLVASAVQQSVREKRLDTLAFHDSLTGLPNRALLQDRLEQTLLSARRHRRSFAAHYIDIDHFKTLNDTYGHDFGDSVLIEVGRWLRSTLRDSDTIARIGGDEFVVLQPEVDSMAQAEELAAKLVTIRDQRFTINGHELRVTISVGGAVFPADAENPVDMLRAADSALYEVKNRGRDGYTVGTVR